MYNNLIFCDASAYDIGYIAPEYIAGRVIVNGRGGAILQPAAFQEKRKSILFHLMMISGAGLRLRTRRIYELKPEK